ncbi:spore coat protein YsxE [Virgibacillus natechei]|uniref:Spore coat protein YsxE n=1 Tax=Virgibacillus natechei TaxID=1216297 RepID=A0ABS4ICY7_9BACI|nr:hypothetical protein [Virgibacillus natechei]MBP1968808.1 spore coat protein YsxE [Virgibacillus natechei]UZD11607.1 hypothetical protein OLD84_11625 [Virgibacillus natechei]
MEIIKKVLNAYAIHPLNIEHVTDRLIRVSDGQGDYALKSSLLSKESVSNWENVYHLAFSKQVSTVLPVYLTKNGNLYVEMDQTIFYLTPWIETEQTKSSSQVIDYFYKSIGTVHAKTKQSQSISTGNLTSDFNTYKRFCEITQRDLLKFVEQFEQNRYMSPFELLVCTHYRDIEFALKEINRRIDQFIEEQEQEITWNYSLCHGNLNFSHTRNTHLINWENSFFDNAVVDLALFFKQEVSFYDQPINLFMEQFSTYYNENKLSQNELYLLTIHLLNPSDYVKLIQQYVTNGSKDSMVNQVINLQHAYRQILFGLQWSKFVEAEYETFSMDDLES